MSIYQINKNENINSNISLHQYPSLIKLVITSKTNMLSLLAKRNLKGPSFVPKRHYSNLPSDPDTNPKARKSYLSKAKKENSKMGKGNTTNSQEIINVDKTKSAKTNMLSTKINNNYNFNNKINISHTFIPINPDSYLLKLVLDPGTTTVPKPLDLVCALDTSGSMGDSLDPGSSNDSEISKYNRLDLVKHSVNTMVHCLRPEDRLSLVTFNNNASRLLPLTNMDGNNKKAILEKINGIMDNGSTNLWAGLNEAIGQWTSNNNNNTNTNEGYISGSVSNPCGNVSNLKDDPYRNKFVLLLTDGLDITASNNNKLIKKLTDKLPITSSINTFGYSYELDSGTLAACAQIGGGQFSHIPDFSMCNTVFINYLANCLVTATDKATISNIDINNCKIMYSGKPVISRVPIDIGPLTYDQPRHILFEFKTADLKNFSINFTLNCGAYNYDYSISSDNSDIASSNSNNSTKIKETDFVDVSLFILQNIIGHCLETNDRDKGTQQIEGLNKIIQKFIEGTTNKNIKEQLINISKNIMHPDVNHGQVHKAFTNGQYYNKWGTYYLRALSSAILLQRCTNFKDTATLTYGGAMFNDIRYEIEDIFTDIPAPKPSLSNVPYQGNFKQSFYTATGPCFDGNCFVWTTTSDGKSMKSVQIKDLKKGTLVLGPEGYAVISCIVKTRIPTGVAQLVNINGIRVTPFHPIRQVTGSYCNGDVVVGDNWVHPHTIKEPEYVHCPYVYNFVLESKHYIRIYSSDDINNMSCVDAITLGHGFTVKDNEKLAPILEHPFFGTSKVVDWLKKCDSVGFKNGLVTIDNYKPMYKDNLIVDVVTEPETMNSNSNSNSNVTTICADLC